MYDKLTPNLITLIYEYDNTYREVFKVVLEELLITIKIRPKHNIFTPEQWKTNIRYYRFKSKDEKAHHMFNYWEDVETKKFNTYFTLTNLNTIYNTLKLKQTANTTLFNFLVALLYTVNRNRRQGHPHLLHTFIKEPYHVNTVPNSRVYNGYDGKCRIVVNN